MHGKMTLSGCGPERNHQRSMVHLILEAWFREINSKDMELDILQDNLCGLRALAPSTDAEGVDGLEPVKT